MVVAGAAGVGFQAAACGLRVGFLPSLGGEAGAAGGVVVAGLAAAGAGAGGGLHAAAVGLKENDDAFGLSFFAIVITNN